MSVTLVPLYPEAELKRRIAELAAEIGRVYADTGFIAVVVMNGGLFFASDLLRQVTVPVMVDSIAAGSYLHHASTGSLSVRGAQKLDPKGHHILLIDDILDTGLTLANLRAKFLECGAVSCRTCVLIDKDLPPERKKLRPDWYGFQSPDEYLVGFGMDSDELYRNLPNICILREDEA
ncbi:MAG: phosphoribosyltransferase family protein [Lentisphaeria bacterium]|nr:phosphoribosyltransferase family protein [Lentisphaeria bacterium]